MPTKKRTSKTALTPEPSQPAQVRIPARKYAIRLATAAGAYTALTATAASVFWQSADLAKAALPHWLQLRASGEQLAHATRYIPFATLAIVVLMFAALGFTVCFPRFKLIFTAGVPAMLKALMRQGASAVNLITVWSGGACALLLGESLRQAQAVDWNIVSQCFATGLIAKFVSTMIDTEHERVCIQVYLDDEVALKRHNPSSRG
jgi:hypothetical protein